MNKQQVKREYNKAIAQITKLQQQLDQLEKKAQDYAHQLFATA